MQVHTKESAEARIKEIDEEFSSATYWGSWMVMVANEREDLANRFGLPHKNLARCNGRRTD